MHNRYTRLMRVHSLADNPRTPTVSELHIDSDDTPFIIPTAPGYPYNVLLTSAIERPADEDASEYEDDTSGDHSEDDISSNGYENSAPGSNCEGDTPASGTSDSEDEHLRTSDSDTGGPSLVPFPSHPVPSQYSAHSFTSSCHAAFTPVLPQCVHPALCPTLHPCLP